jgi:hypothetical protein
MSVLLPWQWVTVQGWSMTPVLLPGDRLLVRHGARVATGQIVLARFRARADLDVIKRVAGPAEGGWSLLSDNAAAGSDSRQYGPAEVLAVARWLVPGPARTAYRRSGASIGARLKTLGSRLPRRIRVAPPVDLCSGFLAGWPYSRCADPPVEAAGCVPDFVVYGKPPS